MQTPVLHASFGTYYDARFASRTGNHFIPQMVMQPVFTQAYPCRTRPWIWPLTCRAARLTRLTRLDAAAQQLAIGSCQVGTFRMGSHCIWLVLLAGKRRTTFLQMHVQPSGQTCHKRRCCSYNCQRRIVTDSSNNVHQRARLWLVFFFSVRSYGKPDVCCRSPSALYSQA